MTGAFKFDIAALLLIARRALDQGIVDIKIREYMTAAINSSDIALNLLREKEQPDFKQLLEAYGIAGRAYWTLSRIADTNENAGLALEYYESALKLINKDNDPKEYADFS